MSQALTVRPSAPMALSGGIELRSIDDVLRISKIFAASGYFADAKDEARACVKILAGQEMGLSPFASMNGIFLNQQGKLGYAANLIAAKIKTSGVYNYRIQEWTDEICRIEFFERGESVGFSQFGKADAQRANLLNKDTYKSYPKGLYFSRALTQGARAYTPELFGGNAIYTPEELGASLQESRHYSTVAADAISEQPSQPEPVDAEFWPDGEPEPATIAIEPVEVKEVRPLSSPKPAATTPGGKQIIALAAAKKMTDDELLTMIVSQYGIESDTVVDAVDGISKEEQADLVKQLKDRK